MRSSVLSVALCGLLAQVSTATLCNLSKATPIEDIINSGDGTGGGTGGGAVVHYSVDIDGLIKRRSNPNAKLAYIARALRARDDDPSVQCTDSEVCASTKDAPFCYDQNTGNFHDIEDTKGNLLTGDYTLADGRKGNLYTGPHPTTGDNSEGAATTTAATAGSSPTSAAAATGKATSASAAAAPSSAAAAPSSAAPKPPTNAASTGNSASVFGGLFALLFAGLL
ncbi:hypothetical protein C8A05DRAFT_34765 [Staphylotrichum tortipilum]|uniref:Uncharacterized protein n=1 Tax=Staphylotrichum tortipilum TaxID=2831512 RepID=A0AAN6RSP4_9PEZI|nr:hypothetical protein C8A05DRAFT_34765 [Staphylotrichum longicolle]